MNVLFLVISPSFRYLRIIAQFDWYTSSFIFRLSLFFYNWLILLPIIACFDNIIFTFHFVILLFSIIAHYCPLLPTLAKKALLPSPGFPGFSRGGKTRAGQYCQPWSHKLTV